MATHTLIDGDPLWVPLLTHYRADGALDRERMRAHLGSIMPHVSQIMLAGSTGDGWDLDDRAFDDILDFAATEIKAPVRVIFGALARSTDGVIARVRGIEAAVTRSHRLRERFAGITICPPVDPDASQEAILAHYGKVLEQSESLISLYQLPQVTGCRLRAETVSLLAENPRVFMFKDSSGEDRVAGAGNNLPAVMMVRGAEGGYAEAVTGGGYNGWLLSTANAFGRELRAIENELRAGRASGATSLSDRLGAMVATLFAAAASEPGVNAFSNANRAADHLLAFGADWGNVPAPLKLDGTPLSRDLLNNAAKICKDVIDLEGAGYLRS
ncbi:hypothetical protein GE300_14955 [Rhodobacteraceae bacterium 2CG4]|uniref:Dihydrodipicolinate synthase/N-acetylneuraminate lyase n=1 Tax=Halovulum marinum TaxID=2662447 RepID=A0A6L5Z2Y3_9RHOB|nr:dihydrodipicolinate synthase family protein [Halovulum marinum]MSU90898.1 hypothetical protein [Halovulum marinum]